MRSVLSGFRKSRMDNYDVRRLIDQRWISQAEVEGAQHIVCDIDKTYLETEFESFVKIARIAFESAVDKVTVQGATDVLQAVRWGDCRRTKAPRPLHFVSSSPPQLRQVLEEKLTLDGLDWNSDTFKNQAYNIKMGRFDLLRQHIAYKSAAILKLMSHVEHPSEFFLLGDNAESDAYVYLGVKLFLEKRLSSVGYEQYLKLAGIEEKVASNLVKQLSANDKVRVKAIFIRDLPDYDFVDASPLTDSIQLFKNYFEVALYFSEWDMIESEVLWSLARQFHNRQGMALSQLMKTLSLFKDRGGDCEAINGVYDRLAKMFVGRPTLGKLDNESYPHLQSKDQKDFEGLSESEMIALAGTWIKEIQFGASST